MPIVLEKQQVGSRSGNTARSDLGAQSRAQSEAVLLALSGAPLSAAELMHLLGLEIKTGAFKRTIKELVQQGLIEYTFLNKPTSRLQKYRLSEGGKTCLASVGNSHD